ncbi:MAG: NADH-quinone oxidoreductase subunit NuoE [Alphaproteobacteria bacterium]|jgi:NADH-quinone oxidoreductase E subunit|nr:NADH-quinone oxidoreductase subunit NuoE [Alphaproteobacteria bacterium]MBT5828330.1 NADH-quinone oxidoreductase subunit NuoE [Alphaproteobacteria bacterium]
MDKKFEFNKENYQLAKEIIAKYPAGKEKSAVMGLLDLAQRQNDGWITTEAMDYIASIINLAPIRVYEVATFYSMYNLKPVGKFLVQICTTTPCQLRGAEQIMASCKKHLGVELNETTIDKLFTIKEVECLGACVNAPMVQINDDYYEDLSQEKIIEILNILKSGRKTDIGSQIGRNASEPISFDKKEVNSA